ncbi:HTTM domain-containing protein [Alienimonas californiensis]|uniref:Vitamin K-dependent gamma-carboxylase n=1 Tax=Alienimonas californiensis TaxID=2527989 RepID=A0A517P9R0_9PLAN|nr:HTTM domain-containing protein [Alienimonas californiensis]QDT16102.1 Vitamin K-dependent gamma-carboxylase [Alienimonas californiensis]
MTPAESAPAAPAPDSPSLAELKRSIGRFFFAEEVPYGAAAVRIALALPILHDAVKRWPHARELYSADGAPAALWHTYGLPNVLPELPGGAAVALYSLYFFALVAALVGWKARTSCALAAAGCFYFGGLDATGTLNKYLVVATHLFVLLSLSRCGAVWSVDARLARRAAAARGEAWTPQRAPAWPRRLMQFLIGGVYFGAAFTKIHTPEFFNAEQMTYWMVTNVNGVHPLGPLLAVNPVLLQVGAYSTCLWEITFLMMAWRGWGRRIWLPLGCMFHLMTTLSLGLFIFPLVSVSAYGAFLNERDVAAFRQRWASLCETVQTRRPELARTLRSLWPPRLGLPAVPSSALRWGYLVAAPLVAVIGMGAEYQLDPYGERGADGPLPLKAIDPALVRSMTAPHRPPRPADLLWDFDLGRQLIGGHLVGRSDEFDCTGAILAQAWLSPPHDDVVLECVLHHADGEGGAGPAITRQSGVLTREQARYTFIWALDECLMPGPYRMTLKIDGVPVADEFFTIVAP